MSQRPSVESPNQSQQSKSLHSVLQTALGSLDVHLEEELVRYRRQRTGRSVPPPRGLGRQQARKTLDLISVGAVGGRTQPQPMNSGVSTSTDTATANPSTTPIAPPVEPTWSPSQEPRSESSFTSARTYSASQLAVLPRVQEPEAPAVPPSETHNSEANHLTSLASTRMPPDDYLESSEELLRSLAEEEAVARVERGFMQNLLTPLGLGLMLLLLLSSATLGYLLMNPLGARQGAGRSPDAGSSTTTTSSTSGNPNRSEAVGLPNSPNLASKEFVDLNLGTLSTLKANSGAGKTTATPGKSVTVPKVTAVPNTSKAPSGARATTTTPQTDSSRAAAPYVVQPVAPPLSIAPAPPPAAIYNQPAYNPPAAEPPVERYRPEPAPAPEPPRVEPAPVVAAPEPPAPRSRAAETEAESAANPAPAANSAYDYKVVTEYSGDATLEEAQKAIPDAYVRNFSDGARIQLGAFDEPGKAEALAEELEKQGIPAKVEQH